MRRYRIYALDEAGRVSQSHNFDCRDDLLALAEGERLSQANAVEVWEGARLVARVKPGNAPLDTQDNRSL
jgi:hypothetical protein